MELIKTLPPVTQNHKVKFNNDMTWAEADLTGINSPKAFYNSIINTIIVHYQNYHEKKLEGITFIHTEEQNEQYQILCNQMDLFNLSFGNKIKSKEEYKFPNAWKEMIEEGLETDFSAWDKLLLNFSDLLTYKTVTDKCIQLRYYGYQIANFNPKKTPSFDNMELINNNEGSEDFSNHYNFIKNQRQNADDTQKQEHYLESSLLEMIKNNKLNINGIRIEKLFDNKLNFQFPTLLKTGDKSRNDNSPKYIDIFAKHNNQPVIFELKTVKGTHNSRGQYVFEAYGQIINYFVFLKSVFTDINQTWDKYLKTVQDLDWNNPILYIVVDYLGSDNTAYKFRNYIRNLKSYFKMQNFIRFIEVESNFRQKITIINEI